MGCDIHAVIYADWYEEKNAVMGFWEPRDYALFAAMAGVRNYQEPPVEPVAEPRGLPPYVKVKSDGMISTFFGNDDTWIGDHSYSWLTTDEFAEAIKRAGGVDAEYEAALAAMRALDARGRNAQIVFGFDN